MQQDESGTGILAYFALHLQYDILNPLSQVVPIVSVYIINRFRPASVMVT
jgi:hypothetical protein